MKPKQVDKIYNGLSEHQLAALAYEGCIKYNKEDCERILNIINNSDHRFTSVYRSRLNMVSVLIATWGIDYWKTLAFISSFEMTKDINGIEEKNNTEAHKKLSGLAVALKAVCDATQIQINVVLDYMAIGEDFFNDLCNSPDKTAHDEFINRYMSILK